MDATESVLSVPTTSGIRGRLLDRTVRLVRRLSSAPSTLDRLAMEFGVCPRTIRRDLEAISLAGYCLHAHRGEGEGRGTWFSIEKTSYCQMCGRGKRL